MTSAATRPGWQAMSGWRDVWTHRRARIWLLMAATAAWLPLLGMPARRWLDFAAFYAGGALAFTPEVLDLGAIELFQAVHALPNTPFLYPPGLAILYAPLAALPYDLAAASHVALQAAALIAAALIGGRLYEIPRRWAVLGTLAWAPAAGAVVSGQNSAVLLLLTVSGTLALASREMLGGLAFGIAAYRPHLGLTLVALVAWRRAWAVVAVASAVLAFHYLLGVVATGGAVDWPVRWLTIVAAETANDFASVGWQAIGLPGILGRLSLAGSTPGSLFGPALIGYGIGLALIVSSLGALRLWDVRRAVALTCALALFAGPRGFAYDATMLLPAVAVVARDAMNRHWPWRDRWLLAAAYGIALAWPLGGLVGLNPLSIVVLVTPFVLLGRGPFRILGRP